MNRGASHQRIFATRAEGECFEALLADASVRHGVEVHAYCLMTNHFHLLLHNRDQGLARRATAPASGWRRIRGWRSCSSVCCAT